MTPALLYKAAPGAVDDVSCAYHYEIFQYTNGVDLLLFDGGTTSRSLKTCTRRRHLVRRERYRCAIVRCVYIEEGKFLVGCTRSYVRV